MIKLDSTYSDYVDIDDPAYPAGKAINATTDEGIDGTPYCAEWMNDVLGMMQAIFYGVNGMNAAPSGIPEKVGKSQIFDAIIKAITDKVLDEATVRENVDTAHANATSVHSATSAATVNRLIIRDAVGRAKVAAPAAADDIARKAEVETEAKARSDEDIYTRTRLDNHTGSKNNPHAVTKGQVGLGNADNTPDSEKNVKYATSAGNAETLDGYHAGSDAGQLVPVAAAMFGGTSGYIKYTNGLIMQYMSYKSTGDVGDVRITLPIRFSSTNYKQFIIFSDGVTYSGDGNSITREMFTSKKIDEQTVQVRLVTGSNGVSIFAFGK